MSTSIAPALAADNSIFNTTQLDGKYQNSQASPANSSAWGILWRYVTERRVDATPTKAIPVLPLTAAALDALPVEQDSVIRFGHSSVYMLVGGQRWLIDPVFSQRTSPFSFIGPKRFHQPPLNLNELDNIDGVLISHDHYDHLDKYSIGLLKDKVKHFVVPEGVDQHLIDWGVKPERIQSLRWWQSAEFGELSITATPTQHFSGRGLFDGNQTLWASYVIDSPHKRIFFSGDSGYFDGFKQIGERFGPFDLTMMETGAYDKDWSAVHMTPEQTLQAHLDLRGQAMMPVHNATFDLAFHSWYEPLERISALSQQAGVELVTPKIGEVFKVGQHQPTEAWWRDLK
ncbi:MBL fold metallo-hydrolase [Agarivorans sp. 1_MG-2023]|uniref:MBL fold metallo-hydrolase n=1 Tax=Agarivorans sp. 1_MG-2023 TaxID=3062634 RepID=UPI0026E2EA39|nr:MBL fold metallo-hydrolase [Agarivorans sp. 1_MG-2023]MDO6765478.1 MBL fold metallo-hydrolase [Agarivorans sp. 1_MG-2023]